MKKNRDTSDLILVAKVGKSKGLKGEFFLNSLCDPKENIIRYSDFKIGSSLESINFEYIKISNNKLISKIKEINGVDEVKNLTNKKIYIKKSELPELPDNEIYWHNLEGMEVLNKLDENLGTIKEVTNYGSSDILKVIPTKLSIDNECRLIPFIKGKYIISFSVNENLLIVDWGKDY